MRSVSEELRARAEARLAKGTWPPPIEEAVRDSDDTAHELAICEIALELQDDDLHRVRLELEALRDRHEAQYELAPVGFVVVNPCGRILDATFVARQMLGLESRGATDQALTGLLHASDAERVLVHLQRPGARGVLDVQLAPIGAAPVPALLVVAPAIDPPGGVQIVLVDLRAPRLDAPPADSTSPGPRALAGITVLLVDHDLPVRRALRILLEELGAHVLDAGDGAHAIALVENEPVDVLLSEVNEPERHGKAIAREIAARRPGVPAVFMSWETKTEHIAAGRLGLADRMLDKPFSARDIVRELREAIADARAPTRGARPCALVIERNEAARVAMCEYLAELGMDAIGVVGEAAAEEVVERRCVGVVIADDSPPWVAGDRVIARLRERHPELLAILVSSQPLERAPVLPNARVLRKPTSLDALADAMSEVLSIGPGHSA